MTGRTARFVIGMFCALGSVASFVLDAYRGTAVTWQNVAAHGTFLLMSLLLMDHKLGIEVLGRILRKVKTRGDSDA